MISTFSEFLSAAIEQDEPQRLLFLFAKVESEDSDNDQNGMLSPMMCVDKLPEDIESFEVLSTEADSISTDWDFMITVGLAGKNGMPPTEEEAEPFLTQMANDLSSGQSMSEYLVFDRDENQVLIEVC
jgi:hypothetical protein